MAHSKDTYAYADIIEALSSGLYPDKFHVIREYVQNAFDSTVAFKKKNPLNNEQLAIKILLVKPSIFIIDYGTGMSKKTLLEYRKIGYSKKNSKKEAGFRGIGKMSGITVAKKLIVETTEKRSSKKYILEFDCEGMMKELHKAKKEGNNLTLDEIMEKFTSINSKKCEKDEHYTIIELREVNQEVKILFDEDRLSKYVSKNLPVRLNPSFKYAKKIEEDIQKFVDDYNTVPIMINKEEIYKEYYNNVSDNYHILVYDRKKSKLLAYCWYCENMERGQIKDLDNPGFVYRYNNFAIGKNDLTRKTLWSSSSHLAFYFIGEIYILDREIVPTTQRDDFEQNKNREDFYKEAAIIPQELNKIARKNSDVRKTYENVRKGIDIINNISSDIAGNASYLIELAPEKIAQVVNTIKEIEKRKKMLNFTETTHETRELAKKILTNGKDILKRMNKINDGNSKDEISVELNLDGESKVVYDAIMKILKEEFKSEQERLEVIVKKIHSILRNR